MTSDPNGADVAARRVEAPDDAATASGSARATGEAIAADARVEVAATDTRRAEEEAEKAREAAEKARKAEEEARAKEDSAREQEQRTRREAEEADRRRREVGPDASVRRIRPPAIVQGEPIVFGPFTAERPELLVAAAFAGAFVLARILKAITT